MKSRSWAAWTTSSGSATETDRDLLRCGAGLPALFDGPRGGVHGPAPADVVEASVDAPAISAGGRRSEPARAESEEEGMADMGERRWGGGAGPDPGKPLWRPELRSLEMPLPPVSAPLPTRSRAAAAEAAAWHGPPPSPTSRAASDDALDMATEGARPM